MIHPIPEQFRNPTQAYGVIDCVTYPQTCRHVGVDFPTPYGTNLVAPKDCTLTRAGYTRSIGYWCELQIDDWYMVALHLKERPKIGTYAQGEPFATIGASGKIQGIHSHLEGWTIPMDRGALTKSNWNLLTFDITTKLAEVV